MASFFLAKYFLFSSRLQCSEEGNTHPQNSKEKTVNSFGLVYQLSKSKGKKKDGVNCSADTAILEAPS